MKLSGLIKYTKNHSFFYESSRFFLLLNYRPQKSNVRLIFLDGCTYIELVQEPKRKRKKLV